MESKNQPLKVPQIRALRTLLTRVREPGIFALGISRHQLQRALAALPITVGTRAQIERALEQQNRDVR